MISNRCAPFVVDYIAEVLKHLRTEDFTGLYKKHFEVTSEVSTRDQTGFEKTFSGLMKIVYPHAEATPAEIEALPSLVVADKHTQSGAKSRSHRFQPCNDDGSVTSN